MAAVISDTWGTYTVGDTAGPFPVVAPSPGEWAQVFSGFPAGWTGAFKYAAFPGMAGLIVISWGFTIASGTVVATTTQIGVVPEGFYYPTDLKRMPGDITGGGLTAPTHQYAPMGVNSTGAVYYDGPAFTASGDAYWYGQGVYSPTV